MRPIAAAAVSKRLFAKARARLEGIAVDGLRVCSVQIGAEKAVYYVNAQRHARRTIWRELKVDWESRVMPFESSQNEVLTALSALNADDRVAGVVIVRPVPEDTISIKILQQAVDPSKDLEGMHPNSIGRVVYGAQSDRNRILWPCTAKAAVEVLKEGLAELDAESHFTRGGKDADFGSSLLDGVEVLVIGSSDVLVKPMVSILHGVGATVTVCPPFIPNLAAYTRSVDVVVSAANTGRTDLISGDMLKPGCIALDLGLNIYNGKFIGGDFDLPSCKEVASRFSSLVHGIGTVRSAIMCENLVEAIRKKKLRSRFSDGPLK